MQEIEGTLLAQASCLLTCTFSLTCQLNLATSPATAQFIKAQSVNSATASGLAQQAVLLGNTSSPALTASQAQMYLRAQMVSMYGLGLPDCGDTVRKGGRWEIREKRNAGNQGQEEGEGRSPKADGRHRAQEGSSPRWSQASHPWCLPSLAFPEPTM